MAAVVVVAVTVAAGRVEVAVTVAPGAVEVAVTVPTETVEVAVTVDAEAVVVAVTVTCCVAVAVTVLAGAVAVTVMNVEGDCCAPERAARPMMAKSNRENMAMALLYDCYYRRFSCILATAGPEADHEIPRLS